MRGKIGCAPLPGRKTAITLAQEVYPAAFVQGSSFAELIYAGIGQHRGAPANHEHIPLVVALCGNAMVQRERQVLVGLVKDTRLVSRAYSRTRTRAVST